MRDINWGKVETGSASPTKGGYVAIIRKVEDHEDREYLKLYLDIAEGPYRDYYAKLYEKHEFWALTTIKSYKENCEKYFKGMLTAIERSNANFKADKFDNDPNALVGKKVGITVGIERYTKSDHTVGSKLYVANFRSADEIRNGNFDVPEDKDSTEQTSTSAPTVPGFVSIGNELADEGLPFN